MDPVTSSEVFVEDPDLAVTELEDGSAIIDLPEEDEKAEASHFDNLAEELDEFALNKLATTLEELVEKDKEARSKRDEQYEEGIRRTGLGDDAPGGAQFEGASRAVHPVLAEGCVDFAARAIKELFPANGPVRTKITGEATRDKLDKAQRKRDYLNFLFTQRMPSYRDEKEILLTQLPLGGSQYEKYYVDPKTRRYTMEFVPIDKVLLPYAATSFATTPRLTHMVDLTRSQFEERVASGFYRDIINLVSEQSPEETAAEKANDKVEGVEDNNYNVDGLRLVYEVVFTSDIEEEGENRPYVVHMDQPTGKILAIYRNWDEEDDNFERLDWWVEDKFIPWRGIYGIGLPHLIGGLAGSLTGALRALLDSAHINNSPGAVKLKGGRASGENIVIEQTQVQEIDAPTGVDDIRKVLMPLPFNPPSAVLMQLLDWITAQAKGVVATAEEKIAEASNQMPVGTALALIEQGSQVFSSIHARLHESQRRGFNIVCRLIKDYPNEEDLAKFNLTPEDFEDNDDIQPVSDPNIFSEAQRFAQLQEQLKVAAMFPELAWNKDELARRALELLRTDGIESILPKKPDDVTADPVTENYEAVTQGAPLKASQEQDHVAHLREHIRFILDPLFGAGPAIGGQQLQGILAHCQQHLMMMYDVAAKTAAAINRAQTGESEEMAMAQGAEYAAQKMLELAQQLAPMLAQAAQVVQSKMPPPPVDPAVAATERAAMAQIDQRKKADADRLALDTKKHDDEQALKQRDMELQPLLENLARQFEARLEVERMQREDDRARFDKQVELMKNEQDNRTHQITELLKNRDDNQTNLLIAQLKEAMVPAATEGAPVAEAPDFGPMMKQMQDMLGEIHKAKTNDALTATVEGLRAMMEQLGRPKTIIKDAAGRPIGIQ